ATISHPTRYGGQVRRPQPRGDRGTGPGDGIGPGQRPAHPRRSAPERADRQGRQPGPQDRVPDRWDGRRRRQHRRPGDPATRGDGNNIRSTLRTVDPGIVPPPVQLRTRPATRRRRLAVPEQPRREDPAGHRHRHRANPGRYRRYDHRSPRPRQTRLRIRLLRDPRTQRPHRHRHHRDRCAGDRHPTPAPRSMRLSPWGRPDGRRRADHRRPAAHPRRRTQRQRRAEGSGPRRLRLLRPSHHRCRAPRRRRRLGDRAPDLHHQTCDRLHRRRRVLVDADPVHRRRLRRGHRHLDLAGGGRGDPVHRVRLPAQGAPDSGAVGGAPHPRPATAQGPGPGHVVRRVAVPRVLHHHRPRRGRYRHGRQNPPSARRYRAGACGPEELRTRASTVELVFGERRLAGLRGDGVQPHPCRRHPHRRSETDESHNRHPPAHPRLGPRAHRILGETVDAAPADRLAVENSVAQLVRQHLRSPTPDRRL
ncbi:LOW QUALITY PROTEIN: transposase, partial [Rhodococcus opacus PD630]